MPSVKTVTRAGPKGKCLTGREVKLVSDQPPTGIGQGEEAILALKPVTFRYKHELDPAGIPQFGLVAEGVEKVSPDLVARDEQGKPYTVRYEAVNAMLLNEFLKEHKAFLKNSAKCRSKARLLRVWNGKLKRLLRGYRK